MPRRYTVGDVVKVFLLWVLLFLSLPLSPFYLVGTLVYQVGCVHGRLTPTSKVATFVVCNFFAIAWIPFVCLLYFVYMPESHRSDRAVQLDGVLPLCSLVVFYLWGSVVAFRVYSIDDSYEEERDRSAVRRLRDFPLEPPITFRSARRGTVTELANAYELYMALKQETPENATAVAICVGLVLSAITMTAARLVQFKTKENDYYDDKESGPTYALSTTYFVGMFLVFFSTLAFVATLYVNHVRVVWQLTFLASGEQVGAPKDTRNASLLSPLSAMQDVAGGGGVTWDNVDGNNDNGKGPDGTSVADPPLPSSWGLAAVSAPTLRDDAEFFQNQLSAGADVGLGLRRMTDAGSTSGGTAVSLQPYNLGHVRAWDEVRRIAAAYIAAPESTLNAFLTPTLWLAVLGMAGLYVYLVYSVTVDFAKPGPFIVAATSLMVIFAIFLGVMVYIAKKARRHFKFHSVIISRIVFDVACEIDARLPFVQQGIEKVEDRRQGMEHIELPELTRLHDSLLALLSFMDSTSPRPLILGIEQRHVRYAVAYALLGSAIVLFIALLNAVVQDKCLYDD